MDKIFLDIVALKESGAPTLNSGNAWPVAGDVYREIYLNILDIYFNKLVRCDDRSRDIVFSDSAFVVYLLRLIHYRMAVNIGETRNKQIIGSHATRELLNPNWKQLGDQYLNALTTAMSTYQRVYKQLRGVVSDLDFTQKHRQVLPTGVKHTQPSWNFAALGLNLSENSMYRNYLELSGESWKLVDWEQFCQKMMTLSNAKRSADLVVKTMKQEVVSPLINEFRHYLGRYRVKIDWNGCEQTWIDRLKTLSFVYDAVLESGTVPQEICVVGENNTFRKTIILACQRRGTVVSGFLHGDTLSGVYHQHSAISISRSHIHVYYAPNEINSGLQNRAYTSNKSYSHLPVKYKPINIDKSKKDKLNCLPYREGKEQRHLLIGFPMNLNRYLDDESLFFYIKLDLELRIIGKYKDLRRRIAYRPHPDRLGSIEEIMSQNGVEIANGTFESVINDYDVFVLTHPTTSTLGQLLRTDRSIILFDSRPNLWLESAKDLLNKRCHMIEAIPEPNNRIPINDEFGAVLDGLSRGDSKRRNNDFFDYYYRSTNV